MGERGDDMVALGTVHGEALQLQLAPAERAAHRAAGKDRRLHPAHGHGDVGQGQQAAATAQPGFGPVEPEAMFAQQRADHAGGDADLYQYDSTADYGDELMRHDQLPERSRALGHRHPEASLERIEPKHIAKSLGDAE